MPLQLTYTSNSLKCSLILPWECWVCFSTFSYLQNRLIKSHTCWHNESISLWGSAPSSLWVSALDILYSFILLRWPNHVNVSCSVTSTTVLSVSTMILTHPSSRSSPSCSPSLLIAKSSDVVRPSSTFLYRPSTL